ncbi:MAG: HAMP domain-containing sensor histidine kinase [Pseudomonadota bacterium]
MIRQFFRGRLYLHIYIAILGVILMFALLTAATFWALDDDLEDEHKARAISAIVTALLPPADAPRAELEGALAHWRTELKADFTVTNAKGDVLAVAGDPIMRRSRDEDELAWFRIRRGKLTAGVQLADGRWAMLGHDHSRRPHWLLALLMLVLVAGLGAYPVARRVTRRLERLRVSVDELGQGDLTARVEIQGCDEVAQLAQSFNDAAARIEGLVMSQNSMLAGASHELRSPLTRIRMALELLAGEDRVSLREQVTRDIQELDELIEELLAASRFQVSMPEISDLTPVDLLVLAAEECARVGADVGGSSVEYRGETRWLRRLVRNLLENARRHSGGENIALTVESTATGAVIVVEDDGDGVPEHLRERIFEPFYRPDGMREGRDRGVGLGLALVRQIAERHAGSVVCERREEGGTRFVVNLGQLADR